MDITKLKSSNEKAMTMKELMFSFFEYTKQKSNNLYLTITVKSKNNNDENEVSSQKKTVNLNRREEPNDYIKDSSRSIHMNFSFKIYCW